MTSTESAPRVHTGAAHTKAEAKSSRKLLEAGEISEVEFGQEAAENRGKSHVAPALQPSTNLPACSCLQNRRPWASRNSFNLSIFSYMPKDTVAMGHIFQSNHRYHVHNVLFWYPVSWCYKINAINRVDFIGRKSQQIT